MQKTILIAAGVAAAIGPVVAVVGTLMTALAPLSAAFALLSGATALGATAASLIALLGPIGLVVAGLSALYLGYKTLSPALRDNKKARDELYGAIGDNEDLLKRDKASTLESAKANLTDAKAIRENIKARLEQQEALLKKQSKGFGLLNSSNIGRGIGALGVNKKIAGNITETAKSILAAREALKKNEEASKSLEVEYNSLSRSAGLTADSTSSLTNEQIQAKAAAEKLAAATAKRAEELKKAHRDVVASTEEEIISNDRLSEALKVSQREYEITAEMIALVESGFIGTDKAARDLAISLLDSRAAFKAVQDAAAAEKLVLEEAKQAAIEKAEETVEAARRIKEASQNVVIGIETEIQNNRLLVDALKVSQREYLITAEIIRILEGGFNGTSEAARKMAEDVIISREELKGLQEETDKTQQALKKTGEAGVEAFSSTLNSFQSLIQGIKDGDIGSILDGVAGVLSQIFGNTSGSGSSGGGLGDIIGIVDTVGSLFSGVKSGASAFSDLKGSTPRGNAILSPVGSGLSSQKQSIGMGPSLVKVELSPSALFDTKIDQRAASVAQPIAEITTVKGVSQYNQTASRKNRQSLKRRG